MKIKAKKNNVIKLREDIDYTNREYWKSPNAAGLFYFLNKAVVFKTKTCYNKDNEKAESIKG